MHINYQHEVEMAKQHHAAKRFRARRRENAQNVSFYTDLCTVASLPYLFRVDTLNSI